MPYDDPVDEPEQDDDQGAVSTIARYLNPDRSDGDDNAGGWGSLFKRVAGGPRIKPPTYSGGTPPFVSASNPPPVSPDAKGAPGWDSAFGDPSSSDNNPADARNALGEVASATGTGNTPPAGRAGVRWVKDASGLMVPADAHTANDGPGKLVPNGTDASGRPTLVIRPKSNMDQVGPGPTPPTMDPAYAHTQADLRSKSAVTPKYDPVTGKTLDQYKIGPGGRIGRAFADFGKGILRGHGLLGAAGDVVEGGFGDRNKPGYFGKGAVNGQYFRDEQQRQRDLAADQSRIKSFEDENKQDTEQFKNAQGAWKDQFDVAKNEDVQNAKDETNRIRDDAAQERKAHDIETENLRGEVNDLKDPAAQRKARTAAADEAGLKPGYARSSYILTGKLPDEDTAAAKLKIAEDRLGVERDRNDIAKQRNEITAANKKNSATFKDAPAIDKYSDQWYAKQRDQVRKDKHEALTNAGGDARKAQDDYAQIEDAYNKRVKEFETRKQQWYSSVKGGKPVGVQEPEGGGVPDVAGNAPIEQPATNARTGQPTAPPVKPSPATPAAPATQPSHNPSGIINPATKKPFLHVATNPKTKEKVGSDDGKNWVAIR